MLSRAGVLVLIGFAAGACTSAEELLEDGVELEEAGSYEEAAWKYIRALDKDDELTEARNRLEFVADTVIAIHFREADRAGARSRPVEKGEAFLAIDRFVSAASEVGVEPRLPEDYAAQRRNALDEAISELSHRAESERAGGRFDRGVDLLREAVDRFDPMPQARDQLLAARFELLLEWADDLSRTGRFREAVRRTDEALAIAETIDLDPGLAIEMRNAAMEAGTVYVVATPVSRADRLGREVPRSFLADLNDRLELDFWSAPPEFLAFAHPALVRRRLRELRLERESLSRRDARIIAHDLDADFAVVADIDRFETLERDVEERRKNARTWAGEEVVYLEIRGKLEIRTRLSYAIVDHYGDVIREDRIEEHRSEKFRRAKYNGDYHDLDISRSMRNQFDGDEYDEKLERLEEEIARRLAERFGRIVFDQVLSRVR
jgi:hypothetical protein